MNKRSENIKLLEKNLDETLGVGLFRCDNESIINKTTRTNKLENFWVSKTLSRK
jgi:hypothetical protein